MSKSPGYWRDRIPHKAGTPEYQTAWRKLSGHSAARKAKWRTKRYAVLAHYSGGTPTCACCGEQQYEFLALDHKNNDGNKHRRLIGRGWTLTRWLEVHNFPEGFQVLCHNCNFAKGHYGACPHTAKKVQVA